MTEVDELLGKRLSRELMALGCHPEPADLKLSSVYGLGHDLRVGSAWLRRCLWWALARLVQTSDLSAEMVLDAAPCSAGR
jgi:hypothetical protein